MSFLNPLRRLFNPPQPPSAEQAWTTAFGAAEISAANRNFPQAAIEYAQALALAEGIDPTHARVRVTVEALAEICSKLGDFEKAVELQERSVDLTIAQTGRDSEQTATALNNLGCAYREHQDLERAERVLLESLRIREQTLGRDHPDVAVSLNNLAALLDFQGQVERAEGYARAALGILQRHDRLNDIANIFDNLGALNMKLGKAAEAEQFMRQGLDAWTVAAGRDSWDYALSANNLARLYFLQQRYEEAEPLLRQTVEIAETVFGPEHPQVADYLVGHASILEQLGRTEEAAALQQRVGSIDG